MRNGLLRREEQHRDAIEKIALHNLELDKWQRQNEQLTLHIANLEQQLLVTREAESQLDEQKQENLLLKETIDRMKFDMEELRHKADGNIPSSSGTASNQNTISKSLGVEIMRMNNGKWMGDGESDDESESTAVEDEQHDDGDDTEGEEDVIQTIITRKKRVCC